MAKNVVEYEDGRLWFQRSGEILTLGITSTAIEDVSSVERISLPDLGDDFDKDDVIVEIRGEDGNLKLYTPAAGVVTDINDTIAEDVQLLNDDPTDEGWLVRIEIQDESDLKEYI